MKYKNAGVFMDHMEAKVLEPGRLPDEAQVIRSVREGRLRIKGEGSDGVRLEHGRHTNNEHHKHNQEKEELNWYFKELAHVLLPYESILIFGPTKAHNEFANYLLRDRHFKDKEIRVDSSDYLSDAQIAERVRNFFFPGRLRRKRF
jgi:stalled ribosome rescue protein Dom34